MSGHIAIRECSARDGLQHELEFVATDRKLAMIRAFSEAGFSSIEVTSFAHPLYVPQFVDADELLRALADRPSAELVAVVMNERAVERAVRAQQAGAGPDLIGVAVSASDAHSLKNVHKTRDEHKREVAKMAAAALRAHLPIEGAVATAWGCPFTGPVPFWHVLDLVQFYCDLGIHTITLADTTGLATPTSVTERIGQLLVRYPNITFRAHFHDTHGTGIANSIAAITAGIRHLDSSFGGLGGNPPRIQYSLGYTGNVVTEDLICVLNGMGYETGLDLDKVLEAAELVEQVLERPLHGHVLRAGPPWKRLNDPEVTQLMESNGLRLS